MPDHSKRELAIFQKFASIAPLDILVESIEKRPDPEPDILCSLSTGEKVAFEMVEVVDESLATAGSSQMKLQNQLEKAVDERKEAMRNLDNALVAVTFSESSSFQRRKLAVGRIIGMLENLAPAFEGSIPVEERELASTVEYLNISRGEFVGPAFHVNAITSFADVTIETIKRKLSKNYPAAGPLELLAYYELQPSSLGTAWEKDLLQEVGSALLVSSFRRAWLFDLPQSRTLKFER